ncbi:helix-turn-helix domain-containing protein [Paraburkholderia caledonica]|uniref:helix-turn-helix domain-containing protein n=1 Tax=Paraburkholderia caledonica TaxID=134536 RepID=UPI0038BB7B1E
MEADALAERPGKDGEAAPTNDERLALGREIRKLRKARGKPIAELANAIGRSVSFVSQLERGRAEAFIGDLKGVANALGFRSAGSLCQRRYQEESWDGLSERVHGGNWER